MNAYYEYTAAASSPLSTTITLCVNLLSIIALWMIFVKAGEKGWKCLIPIYNAYILYTIVWKGSVLWKLLLFTFVSTIAGTFLLMAEAPLAIILGALLLLSMVIVLVVVQVKFCNRTAKAFGKSTGFAVGLFFLSSIFMCILAFGKSEYQGPQS